MITNGNCHHDHNDQHYHHEHHGHDDHCHHDHHDLWGKRGGVVSSPRCIAAQVWVRSRQHTQNCIVVDEDNDSDDYDNPDEYDEYDDHDHYMMMKIMIMIMIMTMAMMIMIMMIISHRELHCCCHSFGCISFEILIHPPAVLTVKEYIIYLQRLSASSFQRK